MNQKMRSFKIPLKDNKPNRDYGLKTTLNIQWDRKRDRKRIARQDKLKEGEERKFL